MQLCLKLFLEFTCFQQVSWLKNFSVKKTGCFLFETLKRGRALRGPFCFVVIFVVKKKAPRSGALVFAENYFFFALAFGLAFGFAFGFALAAAFGFVQHDLQGILAWLKN